MRVHPHLNFELNEIDEMIEFCDNGFTPTQQQTVAVVPKFELHTMTTNSPSNPMQSLQDVRERLIRQGLIVPSEEDAAISRNSIGFIADSIRRKIEDIFFNLSKEREKIEKLINAFRGFSEEFQKFDSISKSSCSYFGLLGFLNFHKLLEVFLKNKKVKIGFLPVVRIGFFFAFKESMKNTP